jgi:SAM-dependent methyltransferase
MHAIKKIPPNIADCVSRVITDLNKLPFRDQSFEFALASDIIETLPTPATALAEIRRVLRPGGLLLCNIPGMEDGISSIDMSEIDDNRYLFRERFFYQFLTESQATDLLTGVGLRVVKSGLYTWTEQAHPEFRDNEHEHTSRVFLAERID